MNSNDFVSYCNEMMISENEIATESLSDFAASIANSFIEFLHMFLDKISIDAEKLQGYYIYQEGYDIASSVIVTFDELLKTSDDSLNSRIDVLNSIWKREDDMRNIKDKNTLKRLADYKAKVEKEDQKYWEGYEKTLKSHLAKIQEFKKKIEESKKSDTKQMPLCSDAQVLRLRKAIRIEQKKLKYYLAGLSKLPNGFEYAPVEINALLKQFFALAHKQLIAMSKIYFEAIACIKAKPKEAKE